MCVGFMRIIPLKTKISIHFIQQRFSSYIKEKTQCASIGATTCLMLYREMIVFYCNTYTKHTNKICGQNAELFNVKPGDRYTYHWVLNS